MMRIAIFIIAVCCLSCSQEVDSKKGLTPTRYTKESVKTLLERSEANATTGWQSREALRNQMMVLTLTLLVTLFGFAFVKDSGTIKKGVLLLIAFLLCVSMYSLDTFLLEVSNRQVKYRTELNAYLVQIDSLDSSELQSAVTEAFAGIDKPEPCAKFDLLFYPPRLFEWVWYGIPAVFAFCFGFSSWRYSVRKWMRKATAL